MPERLRFILGRILYALITIFVLLLITFILMHLLPGDPFVGALGTKSLAPEVKAAMLAKYGLDKPLYEQFFIYASNVLRGDFGVSLSNNRPVTEIIAQAFPVSFDLGIRALFISIILGGLLGIVAAVRRGSAWDTGAMIIALIGVSIPSFIVSALLQYFLGLKLYQLTNVHFFAIMGWNGFSSKILPPFALALGSIAVISRLLRTSMLDVLGQDYIKSAKAKGLTNRAVVLRHGIKNALVPVISVMGPLVATVLTGTFVVESIFQIPGLGKYFIASVQTNDYPVIAGTTLFYGTFLILCSMMVDIIYGVLDPRVKLSAWKVK